MRQDRTAVAHREDRPAVDETIIEQLASITDGQGFSVLGELLNAFLGAVPGRLQALERAVAAEDLEAVGDQAHSLTGSAASFGARGMADLCRELRVASDRGDVDAARRLVQDLRAEFNRVRAWLVGFRSRV
ncbi:MAG TPA: Hpt domain-containing protein [Acidimicrobiales bacterium]|nr:Hpt domain-containing protein [Acidimicrobiales bacterium]